MVAIGGAPILWHIMHHYASFGHKDFIIALGYKGEVIKDYFFNYLGRRSDFSIDLSTGTIEYLSEVNEDWRITLLDTGLSTSTGGRLKRLERELTEPFMLTYGDGLGNVNIHNLYRHHVDSGRLVTVTAVRPEGRFGSLQIEGDTVVAFSEKIPISSERVNAGFFVMDPAFLERLSGDSCVLESSPLAHLAVEGQLTAYLHDGFWMPMDTIRDKNQLEELWRQGNPPWREL